MTLTIAPETGPDVSMDIFIRRINLVRDSEKGLGFLMIFGLLIN